VEYIIYKDNGTAEEYKTYKDNSTAEEYITYKDNRTGVEYITYKDNRTAEEYITLAWEPSAAQVTHSYSRRLPAFERFYRETKSLLLKSTHTT